MKHMLLFWIAISLFVSCQNDRGSGRINREGDISGNGSAVEKDAELVRELAASNYAEIEMARTAGQKTENNEVKDLAAMLEADHAILVGQLKEYAAKRHIGLPEAASPDATEDVREMAENDKPAVFDRKWCAVLLEKHEQTISKMERAATDATDPDLKAWLNATLPKIRLHREKLMECNNSLR